MLRIAVSASPDVLPGGEGLSATCVEAARRYLEDAGCAVQVFPATGAGGRALEAAVSAGRFTGVLDLTTSELAEELLGGPRSAGAERLTAAALHCVPQVIVPGAVDAVSHAGSGSLPESFRGRPMLAMSPELTLIRTTPQENDRIGRDIALKASAARGPAVVALPLRGLSALDRQDMPFCSPEADAALFQSIRNWIGPAVRLVEFDLHVNDAAFARSVAALLLEQLPRTGDCE
jgi:uncharacterized protein (UPF0261 family)